MSRPSFRDAPGFTLVEVLVALTILAIGFGLGFQAISGGQDRLSREEAQQASLDVAQSLLARVGRDIPIRIGRTGGQTAGGVSWTIEMGPYDGADLSRPDQVAGLEVDVTAARGSGRRAQPVHLKTIVLVLNGTAL